MVENFYISPPKQKETNPLPKKSPFLANPKSIYHIALRGQFDPSSFELPDFRTIQRSQELAQFRENLNSEYTTLPVVAMSATPALPQDAIIQTFSNVSIQYNSSDTPPGTPLPNNLSNVSLASYLNSPFMRKTLHQPAGSLLFQRLIVTNKDFARNAAYCARKKNREETDRINRPTPTGETLPSKNDPVFGLPGSLRSTLQNLRLPPSSEPYQILIHDHHPLSQLTPEEQNIIIQTYLQEWSPRHKARNETYTLPTADTKNIYMNYQTTRFKERKLIGAIERKMGEAVEQSQTKYRGIVFYAQQFQVSPVVIHIILNPDLNLDREKILLHDYLEELEHDIYNPIYDTLKGLSPSSIPPAKIASTVEKIVNDIIRQYLNTPIYQPKDHMDRIHQIALQYKISPDIVEVLLYRFGVRHPDSKSWIELCEQELESLYTAGYEVDRIYENAFLPAVDDKHLLQYPGMQMTENGFIKKNFYVSVKSLKQAPIREQGQLHLLFSMLNEYCRNQNTSLRSMANEKLARKGGLPIIRQFPDFQWILSELDAILESVRHGITPKFLLDKDPDRFKQMASVSIELHIRRVLLWYLVSQWIQVQVIDAKDANFFESLITVVAKLQGRSRNRVRAALTRTAESPEAISMDGAVSVLAGKVKKETSTRIASEDIAKIVSATMFPFYVQVDYFIPLSITKIPLFFTEEHRTLKSSLGSPFKMRKPGGFEFNNTTQDQAIRAASKSAETEQAIKNPSKEPQKPYFGWGTTNFYKEIHSNLRGSNTNRKSHEYEIGPEHIPFKETTDKPFPQVTVPDAGKILTSLIPKLLKKDVDPSGLEKEITQTLAIPTPPLSLQRFQEISEALLGSTFIRLRGEIEVFMHKYLHFQRQFQSSVDLYPFFDAVLELFISRFTYRISYNNQGFLVIDDSIIPDSFTKIISSNKSGQFEVKKPDYSQEKAILKFLDTYFEQMLNSFQQFFKGISSFFWAIYRDFEADKEHKKIRTWIKNLYGAIMYQAYRKMINRLAMRPFSLLVSEDPAKPEFSTKISFFTENTQYVIMPKILQAIINGDAMKKIAGYYNAIANIFVIPDSTQPFGIDPLMVNIPLPDSVAVQRTIKQTLRRILPEVIQNKGQTDQKAREDFKEQILTKGKALLEEIGEKATKTAKMTVSSFKNQLLSGEFTKLMEEIKNFDPKQAFDRIFPKIDLASLTFPPDIKTEIHNRIEEAQDQGALRTFRKWRGDDSFVPLNDSGEDFETQSFSESADVRLTKADSVGDIHLQSFFKFFYHYIQPDSLTIPPQWKRLTLSWKIFTQTLSFLQGFSHWPTIDLDYPHFATAIKLSSEIDQIAGTFEAHLKRNAAVSKDLEKLILETSFLNENPASGDAQKKESFTSWLNLFTKIEPLSPTEALTFFENKRPLEGRFHPVFFNPPDTVRGAEIWFKRLYTGIQKIQGLLLNFYGSSQIKEAKWKPEMLFLTNLVHALRDFMSKSWYAFLAEKTSIPAPEENDFRFRAYINRKKTALADYIISPNGNLEFHPPSEERRLTDAALITDRLQAGSLYARYLIQELLAKGSSSTEQFKIQFDDSLIKVDLTQQQPPDKHFEMLRASIVSECEQFMKLLGYVEEEVPKDTSSSGSAVDKVNTQYNFTKNFGSLNVKPDDIDRAAVAVNRLTDLWRKEYRIVKVLKTIKEIKTTMSLKKSGSQILNQALPNLQPSTVQNAPHQFPVIPLHHFNYWQSILPRDNDARQRLWGLRRPNNGGREMKDLPENQRSATPVSGDLESLMEEGNEAKLNYLVNRPTLWKGKSINTFNYISDIPHDVIPPLLRCFNYNAAIPEIVQRQSIIMDWYISAVAGLQRWFNVPDFSTQQKRTEYKIIIRDLLAAYCDLFGPIKKKPLNDSFIHKFLAKLNKKNYTDPKGLKSLFKALEEEDFKKNTRDKILDEIKSNAIIFKMIQHLLDRPPRSSATYFEIAAKKACLFSLSDSTIPEYYFQGALKHLMVRGQQLYVVRILKKNHITQKDYPIYYFVHVLRTEASSGKRKEKKKKEKRIQSSKIFEQISNSAVEIDTNQAIVLVFKYRGKPKENEPFRLADTSLFQQKLELLFQSPEYYRNNQAKSPDPVPEPSKASYFRYDDSGYTHHPMFYVAIATLQLFLSMAEYMRAWMPESKLIPLYPLNHVFKTENMKGTPVLKPELVETIIPPDSAYDVEKVQVPEIRKKLTDILQESGDGKSPVLHRLNRDSFYSQKIDEVPNLTVFSNSLFTFLVKSYTFYELLALYWEKRIDSEKNASDRVKLEQIQSTLTQKNVIQLLQEFLPDLYLQLKPYQKYEDLPDYLQRFMTREFISLLRSLVYPVIMMYAGQKRGSTIKINNFLYDLIGFPTIQMNGDGRLWSLYEWKHAALIPKPSYPAVKSVGIDLGLHELVETIPQDYEGKPIFPTKTNEDYENVVNEAIKAHQSVFPALFTKYPNSKTADLKDKNPKPIDPATFHKRSSVIFKYLLAKAERCARRREHLQGRSFSNIKDLRRGLHKEAQSRKEAELNRSITHLAAANLIRRMEQDCETSYPSEIDKIHKKGNYVYGQNFSENSWKLLYSKETNTELFQQLTELMENQAGFPLNLSRLIHSQVRFANITYFLEDLSKFAASAGEPVAWKKSSWLRGSTPKYLTEAAAMKGFHIFAKVPPAYTSKLFHTVHKEGAKGFIVYKYTPSGEKEPNIMIAKPPLEIFQAKNTLADSYGIPPEYKKIPSNIYLDVDARDISSALPQYAISGMVRRRLLRILANQGVSDGVPIFIKSGAGNLIRYIEGSDVYYCDRDINAAINIGNYHAFKTKLWNIDLILSRMEKEDKKNLGHNYRQLIRLLFHEGGICDRLGKIVLYLTQKESSDKKDSEQENAGEDPEESDPEDSDEENTEEDTEIDEETNSTAYNYIKFRELLPTDFKNIVAIISRALLYLPARPNSGKYYNMTYMEWFKNLQPIFDQQDIAKARNDLENLKLGDPKEQDMITEIKTFFEALKRFIVLLQAALLSQEKKNMKKNEDPTAIQEAISTSLKSSLVFFKEFNEKMSKLT